MFLCFLFQTLSERIAEKFIPFTVRNIFAQNEHLETECEHLKSQLLQLYHNALEYLNTWTEQFDEFKIFTWMNLSKVPAFEDIQTCINYLHGKNIIVNEDVCFNQFCALKEFVTIHHVNDDFKKKLADQKWLMFFKYCSSIEQYSELLTIAEYFFAIPAHNANVERIFSLIGVQWTDERNRLLVESVRNIALMKYNFKDLDCFDFFKMISEKHEILRKVKSNEKYLYERRNPVNKDE